MRSMLSGVLVLGMMASLASAARADDRDQAVALLDKAIKAAGGEEILKKSATANMTGKGNIDVGGMMIAFTIDGSFVTPSKARTEIDVDVNGMKIKVINVLNGAKGWVSQMGNVMDMDADAVKEAQEQGHGRWIETLVPVKDKAFMLSLLGEAMVNGRPAQGIRVSYPDRRDVSLYFDKETNLLVKTETRSRNPFTMAEALQETTYSDFKEMNGMKQPTKIKVLMDGMPFMNAEDLVVKPVDKFDDALFSAPK